MIMQSAQSAHHSLQTTDGSNTTVGIVDIGSNSIRLVVYAGKTRAPLQLFNEKAECALAEGLQTTGSLNPERIEQALSAIGRFVRLAHAMNVSRLFLLATAAVRDATDGPEFIKRLHDMYSVTVDVLSGHDEARYAALGVMSCTPDAVGVVADLGGGSLELVDLSEADLSSTDATASLPLGVLRLVDLPKKSVQALDQHINAHFQQVPWLGKRHTKNLFVIGGALRTVAKVIMRVTNHPLQIVDKFSLSLDDALAILPRIAKMDRTSLENDFDVSGRRIEHFPYAVKLLITLLEKVRPERLVFSIHGVREGYYFSQLPENIRLRDPLEDIFEAVVSSSDHRFGQQPAVLMEWLCPLFGDETPRQLYLRYAACAVGDLYWNEHPNFRGQQAFFKMLSMPLVGFDHQDRVALALSTFYRYQTNDNLAAIQQVMPMLSRKDKQRVQTIGYALRLAHTISGGALGILTQSSLRLTKNRLILSIPKNDPAYLFTVFDKPLDRLARYLSVNPSIERV